jgi:hypothetical protein
MLLDNLTSRYEFKKELYEDLRNALSFDQRKQNEDLD